MATRNPLIIVSGLFQELNTSSDKLNFAGNILIKLNSEVIECFLEDISDPWETKNKPKHDPFND